MRKTIVLLFGVLCLALVGCSSSMQVQRRSNLMSYLYPDAKVTPRAADNSVRLQLPLRIGVAFVPSDSASRFGSVMMAPDAEKQLIDIVRKSFEHRDWIREIVTIPSNYLVPHGGFENLQQVAQLMNVDVVALVSVDQLQTSDPRALSFLYISIVGEYVLPLDHNQTRTLIDMAVFHVPSRTFLLRAPGSSALTGNSTAVEVNEQLREKSRIGFERAMADLSKNLDTEVSQFKASVASGERKDVDIYTSKGESVRGGGAMSWLDAALALLITAAGLMLRKS